MKTQISKSSKKSWATIGDQKHFYRSSWEITYARYLEFLKSRKKILSWDYEPETFWFDNIKRGVCSDKPDFKVENLDGSIEYHEVKGYMDARSKTKLKRMAKYHPKIKMVVIDKDIYKQIKQYERLYA